MPQCINGNWKVKDNPYGKGSRPGDLLESTFRTRRRATKINEGVQGRCRVMTDMMEKHHLAVEDRNQKIMNRIRKSLIEMQAYKRVLHSYRANNFRTMQWGFKPRQIRTPKSFQQYKLETRVYNCGFSVDTLQPEVTQIMELQKPENVKRAVHKNLLEAAKKRSDFMIDRRLTDEGMKRERQMTMDRSDRVRETIGLDLNLRMKTSI